MFFSAHESDEYESDYWEEISSLMQTAKLAILQKRKKKRRARKMISQFGNRYKSKINSTNKADVEERKNLTKAYRTQADHLTSSWKAKVVKLQKCAEDLKKQTSAFVVPVMNHQKRKSKLEKLHTNFQRSSSVVEKFHQQQLTDSNHVLKNELRKSSKKYRHAVERSDLAKLKMRMQVLLLQI